MLKRIIKTLFGCYAVLVFSLSLIVVFIGYFLIFSFAGKKSAPHIAHSLSRKWAVFLFRAFFFRCQIEGREKISRNTTYVFVANHRSTLDIPLYALACENTFKFLSKAELTKIPLLGYVIKNLYITVNRSDKHDRHRSIDAMKKCIEENISVFLCPEGTRNITDKPLTEFKDGAFRLAIATQKPVAVLTVFNTHVFSSPKNAIVLTPGTIRGMWNEPIETTGMTEKDVAALKEKVKAIMEENLKRFEKV